MHCEEQNIPPVSVVGPEILEPTDLIPLTPFSRSAEIRLPVFTSQSCWEEVVRHGPFALVMELNKAIENALNQVGSRRADYAYIDFKFYKPLDDEGKRTEKVRMRAKLYLSQETEQIWISLSKAPEQSVRGVSLAS